MREIAYSPHSYEELLNDVRIHGLMEIHSGYKTFAGKPIIFSAGSRERVHRPGFNFELAYLEGLMIVAGTTDREAIELTAPVAYRKGFWDNPNVEYGEMYRRAGCSLIAGGWHLTRKGVVPTEFGTDWHHMPCAPAIHIQTLPIMDNILQINVFQRSWDLVRGLPYNIVMWQVAGQAWAQQAGLHSCYINFLVSNPHIYVDDPITMYDNVSMEYMSLEQVRDWGADHNHQSDMAWRIINRWKGLKSSGHISQPDDITRIRI